MYRNIICFASIILVLFLAGAAHAVALQPDDGSISVNLSLWLREPAANFDADTGVWIDGSPKGNDAQTVGTVAAWGVTYAAPTLSSGSNALVFNNDFSTVKFAADTDDLMRAGGLNGGTGLSELTIIVVYKVPDRLSNTRAVGFGSTSGGGSNSGNKFNLASDMSIRKDNGSVGGATAEQPVDEFFIRVARMNSSGIDQWLNSNGTLVQVHSNGGPVFTTSTDDFYLGDVRSGLSATSGNSTARVDIEIAEVMVYNAALSNTQIEGLSEWLQANLGAVFGVKASGPTPAGRAVDVPRDVVLSWTPGESADKHDVYFGSNYTDVNDADRANPLNVLLSQGQTGNTYDPAGPLDFGQTYYWRIDEVGPPPASKVEFKGDIWSFTLEPVGYPVGEDRIAVTASSQNSSNEGPEKTVDGSGLDESGGHSQDSADMWLSAESEPGMAWIKYDLDQAYKLSEMLVWNHNGGAEQIVGFGIKEAVIEYSADGNDFAVLGTVELVRTDQSMVDLQGVVAKSVRITIQSNWGGFFPQYGLSEVQLFSIPVLAREPSPISGATDVSVNVPLGWRAGREAAAHDVYLSTDEQTVVDGTAPVIAVAEAGYAASLDLNSTYYWRVDEVNDSEVPSLWAGPVWSFGTVASLVVDDFESYNNVSPNRPFQTWLDGYGYSADEYFPVAYNGNGTGAGIGHDIWSLSSPYFDGSIMETSNTMAGSSQSMPFYYSNTGGAASQTKRSFAVPQDWTAGGIQTLSIAFSGQAGNTGILYVMINDTKVTYDGDPANLALTAWQAWNVDLSSMDVQNVTTLQIGVEGDGVAGMILIDDIKLHAEPGEVITPVDPGTANLVGAWRFDEGSGTVAGDTSGHGRTGTLVGATWAPGIEGSALLFDEMAYVETGYAGITGTASRTCCAWIKTAEADRVFVSWGLNTVGKKWRMRLDATGGLRIEVNGGSHFGQAFLADDEWHHTAVVLEDDGTPDCSETLLYVDGIPEKTAAVTSTAIDTDPTGEFRIGKSTYDAFGFIGLIDDVRVYDRALSAGEVLSLTGRTTPVDKPF